MILMKMKTLVDALPSIRKISGQDLSMKTLYRAKRLLDKLEAHLRFYDEKRTEIMERCCTVKEGKYVPKPDMAEALEADMRLSYADLCALDGLVEIEFEEETK